MNINNNCVLLQKSNVMENVGRKLILHKGSKIKSYKMYFKQTVVKFSKKNSIKSASLKFNADHRWEENG